MPRYARDYAAMATLVTSAQVAKAWVRPDRMFAAVSCSRRPGKTVGDLGFREAGWAVVAGNDSDRDAGETFRLHFPEAVFFEGPIAGLTVDEVFGQCGLEDGELDCLIGGPPCQSFSYNNHQRSDSDDRARKAIERTHATVSSILNHSSDERVVNQTSASDGSRPASISPMRRFECQAQPFI
jgi:hypothetical protein